MFVSSLIHLNTHYFEVSLGELINLCGAVRIGNSNFIFFDVKFVMFCVGLRILRVHLRNSCLNKVLFLKNSNRFRILQSLNVDLNKLVIIKLRDIF